MNITERPEWQQRVLKEREVLDENMVRLHQAIVKPNVLHIKAEDHELLKQQYNIMQMLLEVLDKRIARF